MSTPLNIILKSFDGPRIRPMLKAAFAGRSIGTCISIVNRNEPAPEIPAARHVWMPANPLRAGQYSNVDWNTIAPLDAELIESMAHCETMFLAMIERYALNNDIPYAERKRQYLAHLRYWDHVLRTEKIGLYLLNHSPHQCFDLVIYDLCKLRGIPTYLLDRCYNVDGVFLVKDFEKSAEQLLPAMEKLRMEYADQSKQIPLSPSYEAFYTVQTTQMVPAWSPGKRDEHLTKKNFFSKWIGKSLELLHRNPVKFLKAVISPDVWTRKFKQHRTARFYDEHTVEPDFSLPYIYMPLSKQPEDGVLPRGGAFANQELMVQLVAAHVPPGVCVYLKEHPAQGELFRSEAFYRSIRELPNVRFVPRSADSLRLIHNAKAIATITGTAGFEAIFRGKPVLMFGHRFCQYAPGTYMIRSAADCRSAMEQIFEKGETPPLRDVRLFMKAVEETSVPFEGGQLRPDQAPREERARVMGEMVSRILAPLFL